MPPGRSRGGRSGRYPLVRRRRHTKADARGGIMRIGSATRIIAWMIVLLPGAGMPAEAADARLKEAVRSGDHALLRALIEQGVDVNAPEGDGATLLHWAVRWDDVAAVDLLLQAGARPGATNAYGVTPLSLACVNRSAPVVERLLAAGADASAATSMGETVLMTCARTGAADSVRALLDAGAGNVNARDVVAGTDRADVGGGAGAPGSRAAARRARRRRARSDRDPVAPRERGRPGCGARGEPSAGRVHAAAVRGAAGERGQRETSARRGRET